MGSAQPRELRVCHRANARTIDSIDRLVPRELTPADALRQGARTRPSGDDGNLLFTFMVDIEVAAASVELEAVREAHG